MILASLLFFSNLGLLPIQQRLDARSFPSVCADGTNADRMCAYDGAETPFTEPPIQVLARHDLIIMPVEKLGLKWYGHFAGEASYLDLFSILEAQAWRKELARLNPSAIVLAEVPYFDAPVESLPLGSELWRRKADGHLDITVGETGSRGRLKFESAAFRKLIETRIHSLMASGVVDGVELKGWDVDSPQRLLVAQAARRGLGKDGLLILETGPTEPLLSSTYTNGLVMGGFGKVWTEYRDADRIATWVETHTRKPNFTVLEGLADRGRTSLFEMRAATTLGLAIGDGFVSFADTSGHDWYEFWDRTLGRPVGKRFMKNGALWREFENGTAIFNPVANNSETINFNELRTSEAKSISLHKVSVQPGDGDIMLSKPPKH